MKTRFGQPADFGFVILLSRACHGLRCIVVRSRPGARPLEDDMAAKRVPDVQALPQRAAFGLGARLAVSVTVVVTGVMGSLSGLQLAIDLEAEQRERESLLAVSLPPLVTQLQSVGTQQEARDMLTRFHAYYGKQGHARHSISLVDPAGRVLLETGDKHSTAAGEQSVTASAAVAMPALWPSQLRVVVTQRAAHLSSEWWGRWQAWALHVGLTAGLILSLLFIVIRSQITAPIDRLLSGIRKMELGYWDGMPDPGGAWELRWLAWRFRCQAEEQASTLEHLLAAHRRAYTESSSRDALAGPPGKTADSRRVRAPQERCEKLRALVALIARLRRLRSASPDDAEARMLARITWTSEAHLAERLECPSLRVELEDAALRVLQPQEFAEMESKVGARRLELATTASATLSRLQETLASRGVPVVAIYHRFKHVAGVWKKMREKGLAFEQVHDLLALRIVVPTEADCYFALGVVHDLHAPLVGRFKDYIAQPKRNGYRGLHTSVRGPDGSIFEVQVRSVAMHELAEHGDAAHAEYNAAKLLRGDLAEAAKPGPASRASWQRSGAERASLQRKVPA